MFNKNFAKRMLLLGITAATLTTSTIFANAATQNASPNTQTQQQMPGGQMGQMPGGQMGQMPDMTQNQNSEQMQQMPGGQMGQMPDMTQNQNSEQMQQMPGGQMRQMDNMTPPEAPTDEDGNPIAPPEAPTDEDGNPIAPPEAPTDENGNPIAPPDGAFGGQNEIGEANGSSTQTDSQAAPSENFRDQMKRIQKGRRGGAPQMRPNNAANNSSAKTEV